MNTRNAMAFPYPRAISYLLLLLVISAFSTNVTHAQVTAGDCSSAVNICSDAGFTVNPNGFGTVNELGDGVTTGLVSNPSVNPNIVAALGAANMGCLQTGEVHSTWMIINIATTGALEFSFGVDGGVNCYDWIMWQYDANSCANIQSNSLAPVACNWNGMCESYTGMAGGPNGSALPAGADQSNFEDALAVTCGEQYIVCFSNFSSAVTNVPLNFFGSATVSCSTFLPITVNDTTICDGTSATLTAQGGTTYTWAANPDLSSTTGATVTATPTGGPGTYNYNVTGNGPCGSGNDVATVTVIPSSNATITPAGPFSTTDPPSIMTAATGGGVWSANCGACIDPVTGAFNPSVAGPGTWQICYAVGTAPCNDNQCIDISVGCTQPDINPLANVNACDSYTLPAITGTNLTGNEAYYTGTGATGTQYAPGAVITNTTTLFIYDQTPPNCTEEETFTITIDNTPPIITCPGNLTAVCSITEQPAYANLAAFVAAGGTATDETSLDNTSFTLLSEISDGGSCPEIVTRTYQIADACGHVSTCQQTITINDLVPPVLTAAPANVTVQCPGDVPAMSNLNWTDNCDGTGTIPGVDGAQSGGNCGGTIIRTWTYTDACGNSTNASQTITIDDTTPPTASNPPAQTGTPPAPDVNVVTDEADNCGTPVVAFVSDVSDGGNCPEIITRTYSVTDACGNSINVTQTFTIGDAVPPTASNPAPINVECPTDVPAADINVVTDEADDQGTPTVTWEDDVSDGQNCPETITRRYRVTDGCGNFIFVTQIITINDITPPTASNPATTTVPGGPAPAVDVNVVTDEADNCGTPTIAFVSESSDGNPCPETITRIYSVTDACGNSINVTHTILITDPFLPTASAPAPINVECIGDVPAADPLVITDEADNQGIPTVTWDGDVSDGQTCPETITRTYRITDVCGGFITVDQIITVNDITPPTASVPAPINVECIGDVPAADINLITDEADNCTANPVVVHVGDVSDGQTCPETITRTYSITDDCGNVATINQIITVNDITPPTASAPANVNVECIGDVPAADINLITDEADNCTANPVVAHVGDVSDGQTCPETITRTYSITDDCGNSIAVNQLIIVNDLTPPTASNPATTTVPGGPAPVIDVNVVTDEADNCGTPTVAFVSESSDGNPCPETITRIYSVTDACGNSINVTHTILITDPFLPTASAPAPINVECIGDVPAADPLVITDEADNQGIPTVTWDGDVSDGQTCPETITRTYRITDLCGGFITVDQIITVNDITPPTASVPAPINVECIGDVPAADPLVIADETDNCTANPVVAHVGDVSDGQTCPETITRTYSITDDCGNVATIDQIITVNDITPPTASAPANVNVECIGDVPAADINLITDEADNCTANPVVAHVGDVSDGQTCPETITRTYSITDDCGNSIAVNQLIIVNDLTPPTASNPATTTVPGGPAPAVDVNVVTDEADNCGTPTVAFVSESSDGNPCPETITRIYSVTDACGNSINVTHTILITDPFLPTASAPAPINVECIGDVPAADPLVITDEADNQGIPTVTWDGDVSDGQTCPETITRTYRITDVCGSFITIDQIITVNDITPPTASVPAPINVECIGDVPAADPLVITDEADNCTANPVVAHIGDISDGQTCPETITRTYSITDDCGNVTTIDQIITVNDITPPTASAPANVNVECIGDVPAADINLITDEADNCTANPVVAHVGDASDGQTCPETITRTYSITDDCGNSIAVNQLIIVNDVTLPTASNPAPISVPSAQDVPVPDVTVVTNESDNCTVNPVVAFVSDVSDGNVCNNEKITRTYSVTDDCGNQIFVTQEITIEAVPPPLNAGQDILICAGETVTITATNPSGANISWLPTITDGQTFTPTSGGTYICTAESNGCISVDSLDLVIEEAPNVSFTADQTSGCAPHTVVFTNTSTASSGISGCSWLINGETFTDCGPITYTFENGGLYDIMLSTTSGTGCSASITYDDYIFVEDVPVAMFTPSQNELSPLHTEVIFNNNSANASTYLWNFGDGSGSSSQESPTHTFPEEGGTSYTVSLIAFSPVLGCTDTAYAEIVVTDQLICYVPNTFTPDDDDFNPTFLPVFTAGFDPYDFELLIFNRWGEIIWESHQANIGWDGTYGVNGTLVPDGTYSWKIEFKTTINDERKMMSGHVNLIR